MSERFKIAITGSGPRLVAAACGRTRRPHAFQPSRTCRTRSTATRKASTSWTSPASCCCARRCRSRPTVDPFSASGRIRRAPEDRPPPPRSLLDRAVPTACPPNEWRGVGGRGRIRIGLQATCASRWPARTCRSCSTSSTTRGSEARPSSSWCWRADRERAGPRPAEQRCPDHRKDEFSRAKKGNEQAVLKVTRRRHLALQLLARARRGPPPRKPGA